MQLWKKVPNFDFVGRRGIAMILSIVLLVASAVSLTMRGLAFGIDFTGGVLIEVGYPQPADLATIRSILAGADYEGAQVQSFGSASDVLIRLAPQEELSDADISERVLVALRASNPNVDMRRVEFVGPQVGKELTEQGGLAMLFALLMILAYVAFRFQWKFAIGSVAALVHDVIITLGVFSLLRLPFDLTVLAAVLAVIGYSLNDTIVVFDRIRENLLKVRKGTPGSIINTSVNQTLARTLTTSLTTLLVLTALFFLGGEAIHYFAFALIVGVVIGTYSSIYVATTTALALKVTKLDLMPVDKKDPELDAIP